MSFTSTASAASSSGTFTIASASTIFRARESKNSAEYSWPGPNTALKSSPSSG